MMNIYGYWHESWVTLLRWNILFFEGHYRPLGSVFYVPLFELFGFNPLPFRIVCFALMVCNLFVVYQALQRITGSRGLASLAALLAAYHAGFSDLYYSSATIYELLCFQFYYGSLLYYVRERLRGPLRKRDLLLLAALFVCALNAKEMAVSLPVLLLAYELLFIPAGRRTFRGVLVTGALAATAVASMWVRGDSIAAVGAYAPSPDLLLSNLGHYLGMLFYLDQSLPNAAVLLIYAVLALLVVVCKRIPYVTFAVLVVAVTPIPVLLIPPRSFYVFYIPMLGWSLLAASVIWHSWPLRLLPARSRWAIALVLCLTILLPAHLHRKPLGNAWVPAETRKVRAVLAELDTKLPVIRRASSVLVLDDPFEPHDWILTFLLRLRYRDDRLQIHRIKQRGHVPPQFWGDYDYVVTLPNWQMQVLESAGTNPATTRRE